MFHKDLDTRPRNSSARRVDPKLWEPIVDLPWFCCTHAELRSAVNYSVSQMKDFKEKLQESDSPFAEWMLATYFSESVETLVYNWFRTIADRQTVRTRLKNHRFDWRENREFLSLCRQRSVEYGGSTRHWNMLLKTINEN